MGVSTACGSIVATPIPGSSRSSWRRHSENARTACLLATFGDGLERGLRPRREDEPRAAARERPRRCVADPAGRAGDDDDGIAERHGHSGESYVRGRPRAQAGRRPASMRL
jgi:hypothetical protein